MNSPPLEAFPTNRSAPAITAIVDDQERRNMTQNGETYLGDGLYCRFDGDQIRLRTSRDDGTHYVFLQPRMLADLEDIVRTWRLGQD